jgi:hypothetical protein
VHATASFRILTQPLGPFRYATVEQKLGEQIKAAEFGSSRFPSFVEQASVDDPETLVEREPKLKVVSEPTDRFKESGHQKSHANKVPVGTSMDLGSTSLPTRAKKTCFSMCMRVNLQKPLSVGQVAGTVPNNRNPSTTGEEVLRDSQCQKLCVKTTAAVVQSIGTDPRMPKTDNGVAGSVTYSDKTRKDGGGMIDFPVFDPPVSA